MSTDVSSASFAHVSRNARYDATQRGQPPSCLGSMRARQPPDSTQRWGTKNTRRPRSCACRTARAMASRLSSNRASKVRLTPVGSRSHTRPNGVRLTQVAPMATASSSVRSNAGLP